MKTLGSVGVHGMEKIPRRQGAASDLKISRFSDSELDMESNAIVSNATLYSLLLKVSSLLNTVHANQTEVIIPDLAVLDGTALRMDLDSKFAAQDAKIATIDTSLAVITTTLTTLDAKLDHWLALLDAKLDQIIAQVTPPETGDFNP
jgi:hypothetical protein